MKTTAMALRASKQLVIALFVILAHTAPAELVDFSAIKNWAGSGSKQAALVIDWNEPAGTSLYWGYRWDGDATGETMLKAVAGVLINQSSGSVTSPSGADLRLAIKVGDSGDFGVPLYGIGYDLDGDGWGGISSNTSTDTATANDSGDLYFEGFFSSGFWGYYLSDDNTTWTDSQTGISGRMLGDGDIDGFSWAPAFDFTQPSPAQISDFAAVPEPSAIAFITLGLGGLAAMRRRVR